MKRLLVGSGSLAVGLLLSAPFFGGDHGAAASSASPAASSPAAGSLGGAGYVPLSPVRVLDSRPGFPTVDGVSAGGGPVGAHSTINLTVTGRGGVPATGVGAVVLNVTAVGQTANTYLTIWPTGAPQPLASNLNPNPGIIEPNLVIAKVGAGGAVSIYNNAGTVNLIADVQGWFPSPLGASYNPLLPARVLDSRAGQPTIDGLASGGGALGPGATMTVPVVGRAGVPATGVGSVVLNITATDQTNPTFLTVFPTGVARPNSSDLNPNPGVTAPSLVIAKVGADGTVSIYNNVGTVNVIADVQGWFPVGPTYTSLDPARVLETRGPGFHTIDGQAEGGGPLGAGATLSFNVLGRAGVPTTGVGAVVLNVTAANQTNDTFLTVYPSGAPRPNASNLNPFPGLVAPNLVIAKVGADGKVTVYNNVGTVDVIADVHGWFAIDDSTGGPTPDITVANDSASVSEDASATAINVLANDIDHNGGAVTIASATQPANGTVVLTGGTAGARTGLTYAPNANYCNTPPGTTLDTFTYTVNDGSTATVTVTVNCVDDPPTAVADAATVVEDSASTAIPVLTNDTDIDAGAAASIASVAQPAHGAVVITGGGTGLSYQPAANFCGTDTFTYTLTGGSTATVTMTVTCVDDPPTAVDDARSLLEDAPAGALSVRANDTDIDAGPSGISATTAPLHGTVAVTGGTPGAAADVTYQPNANYCGPDSFTYTLTPGGTTATVSLTITCVDDAPVVTAGGSGLAYNEQDPPTAIDPGVTVGDVDDTNLESATVSISSGFQAGDVLSFSDQNGIAGSYNAGTGVLSLTGTATLADYQTALASVQYSETGDFPSTPKSVSFVVNDGDLDSAAAVTTVTVTEIPDAPVVNTSAGTAAFVEDAGPVAVDAAVTVTDADTAQLSGATVSITAGFASGEDVLAFTDTASITGSYSEPTLTLSGNATLAEYQAALRSITFEDTSNTPSTATRTVSFQVTDTTATSSNTDTRDVSVAAANDPAVVATTAGATAYTEQAAAVAVDAGVTVTDTDDTNLVGATVTVSVGYQSGSDVLAFVNTANITGSFNTGTGVLTLSGSDTVAAYQTALASVTYAHTGDNPSPLTKTIEFKADDGDGLGAAATKDITITAVNDGPVVIATDPPLIYTENDPATAVDPGVTVSDPEGDQIAGGTVSITTNFATGEDVLGFVDQNGITGSYNTGTGVLTLAGTTTAANYQTALRSVTYTNTSDNPSILPRTVAFQVTDGGSPNTASNIDTRDVVVNAVNDAPTMSTTAGATGFTEGSSAVVIDAGVTVADVDDVNLESAKVQITSGYENGDDHLFFTTMFGITATFDPPSGTLNMVGTATVADWQTALATVAFRNDGDDAIAAKTITFTVNDGTADSNSPTKAIAIAAVNDAPVDNLTSPVTAIPNGGSAWTATITGTISDPDIHTSDLTVTLGVPAGTLTVPTGGGSELDPGDVTGNGTDSVTIVAPLSKINASFTAGIVYDVDPAPGVNTTMSISSDDGGATGAGGPGSDSDSDTVTINFNQPPTAVAGSDTTPEDTPKTLTLSGTDPEGDDLTFNIPATTTAGGTLTLPSVPSCPTNTCTETILYTPPADYFSVVGDTFTFTVTDTATNTSGPATFTVTVTAVNDKPVVTLSGSSPAFTEDAGAVVVDGGVTVTDVDSASLTAATVTISNLLDPTFETLSATPTGSISVNFVAPTLTLSGTGTLAEYQTVLQSVTYNNTDPDPNTTSRSLAFQVNDGAGVNNLSTIVNKTVSLTPVNDPPVVTGPAGSVGYTENAAPVAIAPALGVVDPDSANLTGATITISANYLAEDLLSFTAGFGITGSQTGNTLTLTGTTTVANWQTVLRSVSYANSSDNPSTLPRTVDFQVDDGASVNHASNVASRTVNVSAANDAPILDASKAPTLVAEDEDAPAPVGPVGTPVSSLVDFAVPSGGVDNVTDVDPAPVTGIAVTAADTSIGTWWYSNNNGAVWNALGAVTNVNARLLAADAGNRVYFVPTANANGATAITFRAWDQTSGTNGSLVDTSTNGGTTPYSVGTDTAGMTINPVNDAPSFTKGADQSNVFNQNVDSSPKAYTINPWATAISPGPADEAGQTVDFVIDTNSNTSLFTVAPAVSPTGALTFTTDPTTSGTATITLHIHDNGGVSPGVDASTTQSFTITTVFPPPIAVDDAYTATGNVSIDVNTVAEGVLQRGTDDTLFGGALDKFGATVSPATIVNGTNTVTTTNGGTVKLNTNGTFTYDPPPGFLGADSFFYNLHNPGGDDVGQVTITMSNMIWFFDASNASAGDGRLSNPFKAISSFVNDNATNHGKDGQTLFIASGSYNSGLTLRPNQILIGKGASSSISTISGITPPTFSATLPATGGANPTITNGSGIGLNLANAVVVHGVTVTGSSGVGVNGTSITTATIASTVTITGNAGTELSLQTAAGGNIDVAATITNGSAGQTINVQNRSSGTVSFTGNVTATGASGGTNVNIDTNAGATVTFSGGLNLTTGTQAAFAATTAGTINVVDTGAITNSITTTTGNGVTITGVTIGASGVTFDSVSTSGAANGIQLSGTGAGAFAANGGSIVNATTRGVDLATIGANFTYTGTISTSGGAARSVEVTNTTSATTRTIAFSGAITDTSQGINLDNNDLGGSTAIINFTGGITASTGANAAFSATNGGTVTATQNNSTIVNTLTTTTGTALNVTSTTIGAAGLTFRSISANGAVNGINLNATGSSGALVVTGNSSGLCGGQVTPAAVGTLATVVAPDTADCTGGTIQNTTGSAVSLISTSAVSLTRMRLVNSAGDSMTIDDIINGLSLISSNITDSSGVAQDRGIEIGDFSTGTPVNGTVTITNTTISPTPHDGLAAGISSGTSTWNITGSQFTNHGNAGINVEFRGSSAITFNVTGSNFGGTVAAGSAEGIHMQPAGAGTTGTLTATIQTSSFNGNNIAIDVNNDISAHTIYKLLNNTIENTVRRGIAGSGNTSSHAINVFQATTSLSGAVTDVRIVGNSIGDSTLPGSGSSIGNGMRINSNGNGQAHVLIDSNTVREAPIGRGIEIVGRNGTGQLDVTVTNNDVNHIDLNFDVANASNFPLGAIFVNSNCVTICSTVRADVRANTVPAVGGSIPAASEVTGTYLALVESNGNPNPPGDTSDLMLVDTGAASADCTAQLTSTNTGSAGANAGCALIAGPITLPPP